MHKRLFFHLGMLLLCPATLLFASSLPRSLDERIASAKAICRGTVVAQSCFRSAEDNAIYTKTIVRIDEALKGRFPGAIQLIHRGGAVGDQGEANDFAPRFRIGEERLLFLDVRPDGTLFAFDGGASAMQLHRQPRGAKAATALEGFSVEENATLRSIRARTPNPAAAGVDVTSQAAEISGGNPVAPGPMTVGGLMDDTNGVSSRFIAPDRGESIPYLVDAQALPAGITLPQALGAISNAFKAWSQASSTRFVYAGLQNFGQASANIQTNDGVIRIQLHDLYNFITTSGVLGIGGRGYSIPGSFPKGGMGGNVAGAEFFQTSYGYVVLKHTTSYLQTLSTLEEVLCHELGHVLSLDHSSENPNETDPVLRQAIMYYTAHADGRGAALGVYDGPKIRLVHPFNTPPYGYNRMMDIVTASPQPNVPGINQVQLRGYDSQGDSLSLYLTNQTANYGTFSLAGNMLKYQPSIFGNASRVDPAGGSYYDVAYARCSDGTNGSPFMTIRVLSFMADSYPVGASDGIPDSWMTQYFGNANPNVGVKHKAIDDADGDGLSNLAEFISGMNPNDPASALKITTFSPTNLQFQAKPYDLYEIQVSTDLASWSLATNPVIPIVTNASCALPPSSARQFFRVLRVP